MKKILVSICFFLVVLLAFAGENGLLWKVTGNGLPKPTYILGSHHLAPATMIESIQGLDEALASSDAVYGEVLKGELTSPATQQKIMAVAMAPADSTLSRVLTPTQLAQLDSLLAVYAGMPGLAQQFEMVKPALISSQLAILQITHEFPEFQSVTPFDASIMSLGEKQGKEIGGLETIDSQIELLFGDPISTQAADLVETVENSQLSIRQAHAITEAFIAQDLDRITKAATDPDYGVTPEQLDKLIYKRNHQWVEQLQKLMPTKGIFLVVGSGHLGGAEGLLNLLAEKGYTVTAVK